MTDKSRKLRSAQWFGNADKNGFMYRSWMKNQGIPDHAFDGRPVIGICNTWSELTPCNAHFRKLAEHDARHRRVFCHPDRRERGGGEVARRTSAGAEPCGCGVQAGFGPRFARN